MNIGINKHKLGEQIKLQEFPPNCLNIIHNFGEKLVVKIFTIEDLLTNVWIKTENHMPKYEIRVKLRRFLEMCPYDKCKFVLTFANSDNKRKRELGYFSWSNFTRFWNIVLYFLNYKLSFFMSFHTNIAICINS